MIPLIATSADADPNASSLTISYKQTVVFEGSAGTTTVSGVFQEIAQYSAPVLGVPAHIASRLLGEALAADIPSVGFVVQSLVRRSGDLSGTIVSEACGVASPKVTSEGEGRAWLSKVDQAFTDRCILPVPSSQIALVFADKSQPTKGLAYFPDHLPSGLRITSITLERTSEPVTRGRLSPFWVVPPGTRLPQLPITPDDGSVFVLDRSTFQSGE